MRCARDYYKYFELFAKYSPFDSWDHNRQASKGEGKYRGWAAGRHTRVKSEIITIFSPCEASKVSYLRIPM